VILTKGDLLLTTYLQLQEANQSLSYYVQALLQGEELVILQQEQPIAKLIAPRPSKVLTPSQRVARQRTLDRMKRGYPLGISGLTRDSFYE
jgi:antitoxin (DNA-binding transcriptional repressor) of toxin-antitoxin stability system